MTQTQWERIGDVDLYRATVTLENAQFPIYVGYSATGERISISISRSDISEKDVAYAFMTRETLGHKPDTLDPRGGLRLFLDPSFRVALATLPKRVQTASIELIDSLESKLKGTSNSSTSAA